jgi:lipopolysaccharide export system protein LptA
MRGLRWVLLLAIAVILAAVGGSYFIQKARQALESPPPPAELPPNVAATSDLWIHTEYDGDRPVVEIRAEKMRQIREPSEFELNGVELRIFQAGGYDRVRSAHARYDIETGALFSEGDVAITLDVPSAEGLPEDDLVLIESSGVHFDTKLGKATTDRPTRFRFARGIGRSVGASYDPGWGDVRMHSQVHLEWFGENAASEKMIVDAGEVVYKEEHSKVYLSPWSKFQRGGLVLNAAGSVVELQDGVIRRVEAQQARGSNRGQQRQVDYAADHLNLDFTPSVTMERIVGRGNAKLDSTGPGANTTVTANEIYLEFRPDGGENELDQALAVGGARLESRGRSADGTPQPARVLKSETIKTIMRRGGEEIEFIETHQPGTVEFIPAGPDQTYRRLDARQIKMLYGSRNLLTEFQAVDVKTRTEPPPASGGEKPPPSLTSSDGLVAHFNEAGEVRELQQWGNFRYEEGGQQAKADHAVFRLLDNVIYLRGNGRMWNSEGSTSAGAISLDQNQNRITATGQVSSTRLAKPEEPGKPAGGILSPSSTLHATADNMIAVSDGSFISYTGNVVMWQASDRLLANRVDIDRGHGTLKAIENVKTQFPDRRARPAGQEAPAASGMIVVTASELTYHEEHRLAHYAGGVHLSQPGLQMRSDELRAFFGDPDLTDNQTDGNSLEKALADGHVRIEQDSGGRKVEGIAGHAEYHLADERLVLTGGRPKMIDSKRGTTQGSRLTYYARNDRLLVDGADSRPAVSNFRRR